MCKSVKVVKGPKGYGGPLILTPTEKRNKVLLLTGEKTHPVAEAISKITGCAVVDGFSTGVPCEEVLVAIVDCSGTARCGVYPKKGVKTINLITCGDFGPLCDYIVPDFYVSDITPDCISETHESEDIERKPVKPETNDDSYIKKEEDFKPVLDENLILKKNPETNNTKGIKKILKGIFNK